ncbi:hypothetical protein JM18_008076 [Phytophthora kernoviae]|uniref:Uncharacterized protein n=1 Tax=Phytophthora kernoviae TaxID=325452 RepID=A0A921SAN3_9STRA|nr:hypothetical protein JM18_008076 [Phytophthora kernoviae]
MKTKKSVRFQSFDLSCLNLQYVDDEHVATMVEEILTRYGAIMEHVETMVSNRDDGVDELAKTILRELARMMASPSELYSSSAPDGAVEMGAWKKIYRRAYGGRDSYSQHEIRICGEYFARQFANLLSPRVPSPLSPQFLQSVFSSLASSSVRFKLRELFVANENFEENIDERNSRELLDEDGKPFPAMAPYEHQDLGAAIHWALQESLLYESLVQPLHDVLKQREVSSPADGGPDAESSVAMYLDENAPEDLDHMEKYVLARRFLRFHITRSWRHRCEGDNDAGKTWASIEKVCAVAKRFNFEDEVHLFPLASVDEFVGTLAREETTLQQIQEALQSFYEQKYGK